MIANFDKNSMKDKSITRIFWKESEYTFLWVRKLLNLEESREKPLDKKMRENSPYLEPLVRSQTNEQHFRY